LEKLLLAALVASSALSAFFVSSQADAAAYRVAVFEHEAGTPGPLAPTRASMACDGRYDYCTNYQWNPNGSVAGSTFASAACTPLDPYGNPWSGLDDDQYRNAYAGVMLNGSGSADDDYYCFFYDQDSSAVSCPATTPALTAISDDCLDGETPDVHANRGECTESCPKTQKGNPVDFGIGNKFQREVDYRGPGVAPLEIVRYYNSHAEGWTYSYSRHLTLRTSGSDLVYVDVTLDDGAEHRFRPDGSDWVTWNGVQLTLEEDTVTGDWTVTNSRDEKSVFDSTGKLKSITNRAGQSTTVTHDVNGHLDVVTHHSGRTLDFDIDANGRLIDITDPAGNAFAYSYDTSGRLTTVTYPDGTPGVSTDNPTRQYHYENSTYSNYLTGITDEAGHRLATFGYNSKGEATSTEYGVDQDQFSFVYNSNGTVTITNALGLVQTYTLETINGSPRITEIATQATSDVAASTATYSYDSNGYLSSHTDENGVVTNYTYNSRGLLESKTEAFGTADARTTTTTWHSTFRVPTEIVKPGQTVTMTYDSAGRLLTRTLEDTQTQTVPYTTTGNTRTWTYTYNSAGLVATINGPRTDVTDTTTLAYDADDELWTTTNALGHVTEIVSRDARGLPIELEDANGLVTELDYDYRGRLTTRTVKASQGDAVTSYSYYANGLVNGITEPDGSWVDFEYDIAQRLVAIENRLGERIEYTLDDAGNRIKTEVRNSFGAIVQTDSQSYDELSRLIAVVDAFNNTTAYDYDKTDNLTELVEPLGYDTVQTFDNLDRLAEVTDELTNDATYDYDGRDNLIEVVDPRGVTTTYVYDGLDNLIQESSPDGGSWAYEYDAAGNLTQQTDARGVVTSYTYDALNRRLTETLPAHTGENVTYGYDAGANGKGRLSSITDESGSTTYSYDDRGNVTQDSRVIDSTTYVTNYGYDLADNLTSTTYPSGRVVDYTRDNQGRVDTVAHTVSSVTEYLVDETRYHAFGRPTFIEYGNGASLSFVVDQAGRIRKRTLATTTGAFLDTDGDGLTDDYETSVGLDPDDGTDAPVDADNDGVSNLEESLAGSDPLVNTGGYGAVLAGSPAVGHWRLDDTTSTAVDASGSGHDGTYSGAYTQSGTSLLSSGSSVDFNGGKVSLPNNSDFDLVGDYTVQFFIRWSHNDFGVIYTKSKTASPWEGITLYVGAGDSTQMWLREGSTSSVVSRKNMNDGQWRHVAFVRRGDQLEIWINGQLDNSVTATQPGMINPMVPTMGGFPWSGLEGKVELDEFSIHKAALSPAVIKALFRSQGDKDLDSLPNDWEMAMSLDPLVDDSTEDPGGDGSNNYDEYVFGTDPMVHPNGYAAAVDADGPVAYWPMDDVTSTLDDYTTNGHDGTLNPSYTQSVTGPINGSDATQYDNSGYAEIPHDSVFNPTGDYTIEGHFRWESDGSPGMLYGKFDLSSPYPGPTVFADGDTVGYSPGSLHFRDNAVGGYAVDSVTPGLNDGTWRHLAFVRRGTSLEIWIDGRLDASTSMPGLTSFSNSNVSYILGRPGGVQTVDGAADELAFYDKALSPADIRQRAIQAAKADYVKAIPKPIGPQKIWLRDLRGLEPVESLMALRSDRSLVPTTLEDRELIDGYGWIDVQGLTLFTQSAGERGRFVYRHVPLVPPRGFRRASVGSNEAWDYTYDANRNITTITKPGGTEDYGYDGLNRLDDYTLPGAAPMVYGYDAVGNRTSETQSGVTVNHTYETTSNRLTAKAGASIGHDANGNRTSDLGGARTFTYNGRNRLHTAVESSVTVGTYTYNALGQRARKVAGSSDTDFVYGLSGELLGEYANGTVIREYVHANGAPVAQIESSGDVHYLHTDHLGTPRAATDATKAVVWRWEGEPFGDTAANEDPDGDLIDVTVPLRFPGQYADEELGLYYNYFRTYDQGIGRYTQSDPIGLRGGLNTYGYSLGNL